jgi:hypothetical protein
LNGGAIDIVRTTPVSSSFSSSFVLCCMSTENDSSIVEIVNLNTVRAYSFPSSLSNFNFEPLEGKELEGKGPPPSANRLCPLIQLSAMDGESWLVGRHESSKEELWRSKKQVKGIRCHDV